MSALQRLAHELRAEGGILAATVVDADAPQPHGDAVAVKGEDYPLLVEAIREGYLQHYEGGRVVQPEDQDLALLAGDQARNKNTKPSLAPAGYASPYADPWYGPITIAESNGALTINFKQTPNMAGDLEHFQYDTFIARWDDRTAEPAYVSFALDATGAISTIKMKAVSPLADFSWDFQELLITPAKAN